MITPTIFSSIRRFTQLSGWAVWCWLLAGATTVGPVSGQSDSVPVADTDASRIDRWVSELDADVYVHRKQATDRLISLGDDQVVEALERAIRSGGSVEMQIRAFRILSKIAMEGPDTQESDAYEALRRLGEAEQDGAGRRASLALREVNQVYRVRATKKLRELGAEVDHPPVMNQFAVGGQIEFQLSYTIGKKWKGQPEDLRLLRYFNRLQVRLDGEKITDAYMVPLGELSSLKRVNFTSTQVTDSGMAKLQQLRQLEEVRVFFTPITDKSLETFAKIPRLNRLYLIGTKITPPTVEKIRQELMGLNIDYRCGGFLGVGPKLGGELREGCMINRPQPNSAAERAGLLDGDVIVKYNGVDVDDFETLRNLISLDAATEKIEIDIKRGSERLTKTAKLGAWTYESMP